ncbi:MAG TPA: M48 family metalloprotease [Candidatus Babeliales bacterium]|nr:M48 family metalloprotease [Candidatus Babeliales bacterium]
MKKRILHLIILVMIPLNSSPIPRIYTQRIASIIETFASTSFFSFVGAVAYSYYNQSGDIPPATKTALEKILRTKGLLKPNEQQKFACGPEWATILNTIYIPKEEAARMAIWPITAEQSAITLDEKGHQDYSHSIKMGLLGAAYWTIWPELIYSRPTYSLLFLGPATGYLAFKKCSRHFEKEADDFMIQHATDAELIGAKNFLKRHLHKDRNDLYAKLTATHPSFKDRIANIEQEINRRKQIK